MGGASVRRKGRGNDRMSSFSEQVEETAALYRHFLANGIPQKHIARMIADVQYIDTPAVRRRLQKAGLWVVKPHRREGEPRRPRHQASCARRSNEPLPPVVVRDPCERCGVRADIGCLHQEDMATRGLRVGGLGRW